MSLLHILSFLMVPSFKSSSGDTREILKEVASAPEKQRVSRSPHGIFRKCRLGSGAKGGKWGERLLLWDCMWNSRLVPASPPRIQKAGDHLWPCIMVGVNRQWQRVPFGLARMSEFPVAKWILRGVPRLELPFQRAACWGKSFSAVTGRRWTTLTARISQEKITVAAVIWKSSPLHPITLPPLLRPEDAEGKAGGWQTKNERTYHAFPQRLSKELKRRKKFWTESEIKVFFF